MNSSAGRLQNNVVEPVAGDGTRTAYAKPSAEEELANKV
jgi:hypothetical protein